MTTTITPWLLYEAKNVSGAATDEEKLNVKVLYTGAGQSGNLDGWSRIRANGWSPTIPAGGVRRFAVSLQQDPIDHSVPLCVVSYPQVYRDASLPRVLSTPVGDGGRFDGKTHG